MTTKKKRCATGYNLHTKKCAKDTGDFWGCVKSGKWKGLSDKEKAEWNDTAKSKCNV